MKENIVNICQMAYRRIKDNPIYSLISIFGFSMGMAATLLIYLWINNEMSYDKFHSDTERIYRVLSLVKEGTEIKKTSRSYEALPKNIKKDYAQIEYAAFLDYSSEDSPLYREDSNKKVEARRLYVSNDFFYIFDGFKFIEGNVDNVINNPNGIVLSEVIAKKIFGNKPALGQTIISDKYQKIVYTVTGVLRVPRNTHLNFGFILPENNPEMKNFSSNVNFRLSYHTHTYVKLASGAVINDEFIQNITNYITLRTGKSDKLLFQPIENIHLYTDYETSLYDLNISSYKYVWIFSLLAFLIIFMASFNFTMLETARSTDRYKEIGVRKVNGATQSQLIWLNLSQSLLQSLVAGVIAYIIVMLLLPFVNKYINTDLKLILSVVFIFKFILFILFVGLLAGLYPAVYAASFKPTAIFRGHSKTGTKKYLIQSLVLIQFVITIFFIIATGVVVKQLNFVQNKNLGFNHSDVVVIPTGLWYGNQQFKNELLKNPNILSVSASSSAPLDYNFQITYAVKNKGVIDSVRASLLFADEDFAKTYNIEVVKGKFLDFNYSDYWKETQKKKNKTEKKNDNIISIPIVINQTAEKLMGFDNPIGQRIGNNVIVGVIKDFHFRPLYHPIGAMVLTNDPQNIMTANVKIAPENKAQTLTYIRDTYRKYRDERDFSYNFFDDMLNAKYKNEIRLKNLMILFSVIAILISSLGIMGMSMFFIQRRTKEIGIRKINGATIIEILKLLNSVFVKWVLVAFIITTPIAYYAMNKWLENFAYKTTLSWWIFALAGFSALLIALLVISWHSWRAARRNPVEALRYE